MIHVMTVAHQRFDTRIWVKEIASLNKAGYEIKYHVADGAGDARVDDVEIIDYGAIPTGSGFTFRLKRMFQIVKRAGFKRGDLIHFHDGIFLPFAILLAMKGCRVIYDVHEDFPRQILNTRFNRVIKTLWSSALIFLEWLAGFLFIGFVTATPTISSRFPNKKTITVQNFPLLSELIAEDQKTTRKKNFVTYIGGITHVRGVTEVVRALSLCNEKKSPLKMALAGSYSPTSYRETLSSLDGWQYVEELGWLDREGIRYWLNNSIAGLVTLHPTRNYIESYPVKLFEYMSAKLPVIASDFPLWRQIVETANCGLLVDPLDPDAIADAMIWMINHPEQAKAMGEAGRKAVEDKYNWSVEEDKLLAFYKLKYGAAHS